MPDEKVGTITHYYDKIGVAVLKLAKGSLKVGDSIKLTSKSGEEFTQEIKQMQIDRADIQTAKAVDVIGLKVDQEPKANSPALKIK